MLWRNPAVTLRLTLIMLFLTVLAGLPLRESSLLSTAWADPDKAAEKTEDIEQLDEADLSIQALEQEIKRALDDGDMEKFDRLLELVLEKKGVDFKEENESLEKRIQKFLENDELRKIVEEKSKDKEGVKRNLTDESVKAGLERAKSMLEKVHAFTDVPQVGWMRLSEPLLTSPPVVAGLGPEDPTETFRGVLEQIRFVGDSPMHLGMVIYLDGMPMSMAQIDEMSDAIRYVRSNDKQVLVFAQAYDTPTYLLACAADQILLQRKGMVELYGLAIEEMYYPGLFEKIGVKADLVQVGAYKGAADPFTLKTPSKEHSATMDSLLDDIYDQMLETIATSRKMTKPQVEQAMKDSITLPDTELLKRKLVDRLVDRDMVDATEAAFGDDFLWDDSMGVEETLIAASDPFTALMMMSEMKPKEITTDSLVVFYLDGAIQSGHSGEGPFGGKFIGSRTTVQMLEDARDNDLIKGVILRINSPGGSALASEMIWQAVREVAAEKPVFVSVDGMAASGGYYIACAGHQIYVTPRSIVGSIGVVTGKFVMGDLYEKLGIQIHERTRGANAEMFSSTKPFSEEDRKRVIASAELVYEMFIDRVTRGRGKRIAEMDKVAQGRVFTGRQAVKNGLADHVGGLEKALAALRVATGLQNKAHDVVIWPYPMPLDQYFEQMLGIKSSAKVAGSLASTKQAGDLLKLIRATIGEQRWLILRDGLNGMSLLREEQTLMVLPSAVHVRMGK